MSSIALTTWARFTRIAVTIVTLAAACGCSLEDASGPPLTGPSKFGLSVTMTATPDRLPRDGSSQSVITLIVRDEGNLLVSGQRLTLASNARLSATEVVTDASGQASFTVTAPPASALVGDVVTVEATPVGSSGASAVPRVVTVSLTGAPNTSVPIPSFTFTPVSPEVGQVTTFNASASTDEGAPCLDACTYLWALGTDGSRAGRIITHAFQTPGIQSVTLTVTDQSGTSASMQQNVTVTAAARPTVTAIAVSPTSPVAGQTATFTPSFTVAANHRITRFDWNWGDGSTSQTTNASVTHTFSSNGTYVVTVTATDDLGQTASFSTSVTVGSGVTASFTFSPTAPQPGNTVQFNGSASSTVGGSTISEWKWEFGDGTEATETDASTSHVFAAANTYKVRLTVTDSAGRTGTTTQDVVVEAP